jgi:putative DNA primase/helicase
MADIIDAARGRWPEILASLASLSDKQLSDEHQPCPLCGGTDRYRFDDLDGSGSWFCNQCGGKHQSGGAGNGIELLMRLKGWDFKEAARRVEELLGLPTKKPSAFTSRARVLSASTATITDPPTRGAEAFWRYSDTFIVTRFPGKKIRPLSWDGSAWRWKAPPAPRPLLNLEALQAKPDAPALVVEGEKTADAAAKLFPAVIVTTWPSGCKAVDKADWSPLEGRKVILWPDNDDVGRSAMARIAEKLLPMAGTTVKVVANPPDAPEAWDIADADWTPQQAAAYARANTTSIEAVLTAWGADAFAGAEPEQQELPEPEDTPADPEPIKPSAGGYFTCLGFDHDAFYYQPHRTGQVLRLSRSSHTGTNLVALAPLGYWETLYPGKSGPNWTAAASDLFEQQARVGIYSPDRIRGRGAWWDGGRSVLHLGDRLVVDGADRSITDRIKDSTYLYQRLSSLQGPANATPLTDAEAYVLAEIAERFHWEVPASGLLLAGWVTLAPICGALPWRPHTWLTAAAGSGKSAILDRYVTPLLGDMGLIVAGNTTEPGIRQALRADALPVVFDEAESNERTDQQRMQAILGLARVASSESKAHTLKGTPEGDTQRFTIRSMFLMSSIATSLKQGADKSRFAQLTLRNPSELPKEHRQAHWEALDRDLDRFVSEEIGRRLQARTVSLIPTIRASIRVFTRVAAERFDSQRLGDQYGTLLAGAWSLHSSQIVTPQQAQQLIDDNNWEPYSQATEVPDERRCIQRILQHQLRVETDRSTLTRSIGELVELALHREHDFNIEASHAQSTLGRNGIKAEEGGYVVISNNAEAIAAILRDTAWSNCWPTVLTRLPGATKAGSIYFKGAGATSRAVRVPLDAVDSADPP